MLHLLSSIANWCMFVVNLYLLFGAYLCFWNPSPQANIEADKAAFSKDSGAGGACFGPPCLLGGCILVDPKP